MTNSVELVRVAGQDIAFSPPCPELGAFRSASQSLLKLSPPTYLRELAKTPPSLEAQGWIADRLETLTVWLDQSGLLFHIPTAGLYWTAADGTAIDQIAGPKELTPSILAQSLLGPPLVLALALRGTWCLHASAVTCQAGTAAFLGNSGAGKSTLAAFINEQPAACRLGDDILPVTWQNSEIICLPHFPQLKLPNDRQPGLVFPEKVPLSVIYLLEEGSPTRVEALPPATAAMTLAGHSVAARLFDPQLLESHFDFCVQVATKLPVRRFSYPRTYAELPAVWQALQEDLEGLHV